MNVIGMAPLLIMRNGIQWNPSDDGLVRTEIKLVEDSELRGKIKIEGDVIGHA